MGPVESQARDGGVMQKGRDWEAFGREGSVWRVKDTLAALVDQIWGKAMFQEDFKDIVLCVTLE